MTTVNELPLAESAANTDILLIVIDPSNTAITSKVEVKDILSIVSAKGANFSVQYNSNGAFAGANDFFYTGNSTAAGNVGIGNSAPTHKLRVEGSISDSTGEVRTRVINSQTASYVLAASDNGKLVSITTGGVTVPASVFTAGQNVTIYNNSDTPQTITASSVTCYLAGTTEVGNRTLNERGLATLFCISANDFVISGNGLT